jgi:hypothetical protein
METTGLATHLMRQELPNRFTEELVSPGKMMITRPLTISPTDNEHGTNDAYRKWAKNL